MNNTENSVAIAEMVESGQEPVASARPIDSYFSIEHQGMIASKYRAKYSDADQQQHKAAWPEFAGNHFMMYIMAETLSEARKAVFSANRGILLNNLTGAMVNYTPAIPGAVFTELQVTFNKTSDLQLQALYEQLPDESHRTELLKAYAKSIKQAARSGKDLDVARAKFYHASAVLGVVPQSIW
jgi:hypothetical protein